METRNGPDFDEGGYGTAAEVGGAALQRDVEPPVEETAYEGGVGHDDSHGARLPLRLGRRRRAEGTRDRRVADLPGLRGRPPTRAFVVPRRAVSRDLQGAWRGRLSARLRVRGAGPGLCDCRQVERTGGVPEARESGGGADPGGRRPHVVLQRPA